MPPGFRRRLCMVAFDHRGSFCRDLCGTRHARDPGDARAGADTKDENFAGGRVAEAR
jgi:hypothetical protein